MRRVGRKGDGGKWVCDPHRHNTSIPCLVYSFGSNNDFGFENSLLQLLPSCEVHTFDFTSNPPGPGNNKNIVFHKIGLAADVSTSQLLTFSDIIQTLNHTGRHIAILKVGYERAWRVCVCVCVCVCARV